jgi:hypothetical protein
MAHKRIHRKHFLLAAGATMLACAGLRRVPGPEQAPAANGPTAANAPRLRPETRAIPRADRPA